MAVKMVARVLHLLNLSWSFVNFDQILVPSKISYMYNIAGNIVKGNQAVLLSTIYSEKGPCGFISTFIKTFIFLQTKFIWTCKNNRSSLNLFSPGSSMCKYLDLLRFRGNSIKKSAVCFSCTYLFCMAWKWNYSELHLPFSEYEPRHDKTNKVTVRPAKTQIGLGIRPVWLESSPCAQWVAKDPSFLHADSEDSDQTGRMPGLIWVFTWRTALLLVLSCRGSYVVVTSIVFAEPLGCP